ncbi:electron transport complex subunit RsxG [Salipiger sp. P9]|uniref:electron transport complex subunit RsxG n=1 Tax=Salipiger pentaromativorans TaxID=2943193 RepID=UPI002157DA12|nr:electron transport complex subunit RsxG [Salipiger pentaromativorans]MCR8547478.1 electron transport complex subunit RsxG [Salipiger pentaromativorans]
MTAPIPASPRLAALRRSPGLVLGAFSLCTALILAAADDLTRAAIAARAAEDLHASLAQVLPPAQPEADPTAQTRRLEDAEEGSVPVYLATEAGQIRAVAFELTGYGYGGAIRVLMGLAADGTILGVRVLSHAETPGLGDKIETAKSDWIQGFDGRSIGAPGPEGWKVRKDGGVFDQFSGATITPRAVVSTVHRGLALFERHRPELLAPVTASPSTRETG